MYHKVIQVPFESHATDVKKRKQVVVLGTTMTALSIEGRLRFGLDGESKGRLTKDVHAATAVEKQALNSARKRD